MSILYFKSKSKNPIEEEYNKLKTAPPIIYRTAYVTETRIEGMKPELNTDELDKAEKVMPGLKVFLINLKTL